MGSSRLLGDVPNGSIPALREGTEALGQAQAGSLDFAPGAGVVEEDERLDPLPNAAAIGRKRCRMPAERQHFQMTETKLSARAPSQAAIAEWRAVRATPARA